MIADSELPADADCLMSLVTCFPTDLTIDRFLFFIQSLFFFLFGLLGSDSNSDSYSMTKWSIDLFL